MQAPSADNRHTLRFDWHGDVLHASSTDAATWLALPHRRFLALLAYGAVIENMVLRSSEFGYEMSYRLLLEPNRPGSIAELQWAPTDQPADPLAGAIDTRHTNRRFYRRDKLGADTLDRLSRAAETVVGARLLWLDDAAPRRLALEAIRVAETERFRRRALHQELFGAVRFDLGWNASADEGLPPGALEVERPARLPFALLRHWPVMRAAHWLGMHHVLGLRAGYLPCALAPHVGLLLMTPDSSNSKATPGIETVNAGRAFERMWLTASALGLALQPLAAATALHRQQPGAERVSVQAKRRLDQLLRAVSAPTHGQQPFLFFRTGKAPSATVVTCRTTPRLDET